MPRKLRSRRSAHNINQENSTHVGTQLAAEIKQSDSGVQHHFHYYHHHHHHHHSQQQQQQSPAVELPPSHRQLPNSRAISCDLNKLTEANLKTRRSRSQESSTSSENTSSTSGRFSYLSSSNSPNDITSHFESDFALLTVNTASYDQCITNIKEKFLNCNHNKLDMEDLVHVINDSLCQWGSAYNLFIRLKSTSSMDKTAMTSTTTTTTSTASDARYNTSLLTRSYQYEASCSIGNKTKKYVSVFRFKNTFFLSLLASFYNICQERRRSCVLRIK